MIRKIALATVFALIATGALAQEAPDGLRPLCPDRPAKGTAACTVDKGHWQLEADLLNWTRDSSGGVVSTTLLAANPTLKLGLTDTLDVEANIAPFVRAHETGSGALSGVGDLYLRAKLNLAGNAGGNVGFALEPYLKAPTAKTGIGNGAWEGGLLAPASVTLPHGWSLGVTPEADLLEDASGGGRHLALSLPVGLGHAVGPLSGTVELWTQQDFDPAGTNRQYSLDFAAAWAPPKDANVQLDAGVNLGLNRATPGVQLYAGLTRRF